MNLKYAIIILLCIRYYQLYKYTGIEQQITAAFSVTDKYYPGYPIEKGVLALYA